MARCGLAQMDGHAFGGLNNMVELDLSFNQLQEVKYIYIFIFIQHTYNNTSLDKDITKLKPNITFFINLIF